MSEENVELAARFYKPAASKTELLNAMPRTMELCHPEVEWTSREDGVTYQGREGVKEALERWLESFADYSFVVQRIIDCGGDDVLVIGLEVGTGAMSGAEVQSINHELLTVRDGMIVRFREFYDESDALEAAGLREQGDTAWAMSEENVEIVRQSLAATSGGDPEAAQAAFDPLIEWDMSGVRGWLEKSVYRGPEVLEFLRAWADSWQDWHFDVTDVRDAGKDRVFAAIHEWGIGAESRVDVEQRRYFVFTVRGGLLVRVQMFSESAEALEAAGLRE